MDETPKDVKAAELAAKAAEKLFEAKDSKLTWDKVKDYAIRFFFALFMEKKKSTWVISVGRVSWWMAFSPALYIWLKSMGASDITEHHLTVLLLLAGYNFGKKVVEKMKDKSESSDGPG